jgi:hypothetical protein
LVAAGSRIERIANSPEIAASRRLIVVAVYLSARPPLSRITFGPGRPGMLASRHARRNLSSTSVVTAFSVTFSTVSQRQKARRSKP